MPSYVVLVFLFVFFVNFLLLMGTNQLCNSDSDLVRIIAAAAFGALHGVLCLLQPTAFLKGRICRIGVLILMAMLAFSFDVSGLRRGGMFLLLSMAMGIVNRESVGIHPWSLLVISALILILSVVGLTDRRQSFVPVELSYGQNSLQLTALHDTGNTLRDPLTGKPVLVLGADAAEQLTGLTRQQLRRPVETMGAFPGLRLIPYKAISGSGLLLALRLPDMKVGSWHGSGLVAFAPEVLNTEGRFQALTGGML